MASVHRLHHKFRGLLPDQRLTVEISKYPCVEMIHVIFHLDLPRSEPSVIDMDRNRLRAHHRRIDEMIIDSTCNKLTHKRIRGTFNKKIRLFLLYVKALILQCLEVFGQLRLKSLTLRRIQLLRSP